MIRVCGPCMHVCVCVCVDAVSGRVNKATKVKRAVAAAVAVRKQGAKM